MDCTYVPGSVIWNVTMHTKKRGVWTAWHVYGHHAAVVKLVCKRELNNAVVYCCTKDRRFIGHWADHCHGFTMSCLQVLKKRLSTVQRGAEPVWQTWRPLDQCFDWDSITYSLLAGEKPTYLLYRSMPARMYGVDVKESWGDLRTSRFEHGGHTFSASVAWNTIRLNIKQNSDWLA